MVSPELISHVFVVVAELAQILLRHEVVRLDVSVAHLTAVPVKHVRRPLNVLINVSINASKRL